MGYYSEVGIIIKEKDYQKLTKRIEKVKTEDEKLYENLLWTTIKGVDDSYVVETSFGYDPVLAEEYRILHWDNIKWYENNFPEVDYIMNFVRDLDCYQYIRLGEDVDDTEFESHGDIDMMYINRNIELP